MAATAAAPSHFLSFSYPSLPHKLPSSCSLHSLNVQHSYYYYHYFHRLQPHRLRLPAICASLKKPRARSRTVRSNADLCSDLREFMSEVGLPDGHVPSLKELSEHGRQDLANIVRRRGYKLIQELLTTSFDADINASEKESSTSSDKESSTGELDGASIRKEESTGQDENVKDLGEDVSLSSEAPVIEDNSHNVHIDSNANCIVDEVSTKSLLEKAAKFIQDGELETTIDFGLGILNENVTEVDKELDQSQIAAESDSLSVTPSTLDNGHPRKDYSSNEKPLSADIDKELDIKTGTPEMLQNQNEVNRLKFMLHQKELELSHLKQQIENEKQVLSNLQCKAETEIKKAQKLIMDKDAELRAAEESLSGLEEVLIQFWADAQTVEVAGSFNGWHHPIKMDPQPLSSITDSVGLRDTRLWSSMLWLYPGIYEIKFIVDGQWTIDPERESTVIGGVHNNILRVGR